MLHKSNPISGRLSGFKFVKYDSIREEAKDAFTEALRFNASHIDSMRELVAIYESRGDAQMVKKYSEKIELLQQG